MTTHAHPFAAACAAAAVLGLATPAAAQTSFSSQVWMGGLAARADLGIDAVFSVVCDTPACVVGSLYDSPAAPGGAPVALTGNLASASMTFTGSGAAEAPSESLLRARASLTASGDAFDGSNTHFWFVGASAGVETRLLLAPPAPADLGAAVSFAPIYRFTGTVASTPSGDVSTVAGARVRAASMLGEQGLSCVTLPGDPDHCQMTALPVVFGTAFPYETWLDVTVSVRAMPGSGVAYGAMLAADYSHTLQLVGAEVRDSKGALLPQWSLMLAQGNSVLISQVPEPASGLLAALGVFGLTVLARRRSRRLPPH